MGSRVGKEKIERESGYLYYLGKDGYIWRTPMANNKRGRKKRIGSEKIDRERGYMYYLDKNGYIARARMKNA